MPVPTFPQETLRRLVGTSDGAPAAALRNVVREATELEGFRPLGESLEWRLADVYWAEGGALPFVRNDVPYLVNNSGRLSESAADLVFTACQEIGPSLPERLVLFELGAGAGLFARYFLDAFLARCRAEKSDLYDRLTYVVTDRSERSVTGWIRDGLFAEHEGHVEPRICDAAAPGTLRLPGGGPTGLPGAPLVAFCNYLLDVLPAAIARRSAASLESLFVRTHLGGGAAALQVAGVASLDEARALAAGGPADLIRLLPLLPFLELETDFRPWKPATGAEQTLVALMADGGRVIVNGPALASLEALVDRLHASGFVLLNDYGPVRTENVAGHLGVQRFGGSVALGLNFPLVEQALTARGLMIEVPDGDEQRRIHTRIIGRQMGAQTRHLFRHRFNAESDRTLDAPHEEARGHLAAGRRDEALAAYRQAVERNPRDWQMLGEAAEYVGLQLGDHGAGMDLARAALTRNPWSSAWLWNVLGDCLFYLQRLADAHAAFLEAQRIDANDPRTNLNLAYTHAARGELGQALATIASGLAHDGRGLFRARLLEKQAQVLAIISERASAEQGRLARRAERFR